MKLQAKRDNVQHLVDVAIRNDDTIETHVTTWLTKVDEISKDAEKFLEDECLNLMLWHQVYRCNLPDSRHLPCKLYLCTGMTVHK